jgi:hypothetical protein
VPDSPDELLRDLSRRKIPDVLPHQREIMRSYAESALEMPDVALQLPTGSGKTLVGLLIGEGDHERIRSGLSTSAPRGSLSIRSWSGLKKNTVL